MTRLIKDFEWGTLSNGFTVADGVFRETHPWRARDEVTFVSSRGAIVTSGRRVPYDEPMKFLAPMESGDRRMAGLMPEDLTLASEAQFAMADLRHERYSPFDQQTGLFRRFASLRSEADVITFANRFGPMGGDLSTAIVFSVPDGEPWMRGAELFWAEPVERWLIEANDMARVVALYDLIRAGDRSGFSTNLTKSTAWLRIKTGAPEWKCLNKNWALAKKSENAARFQEVAELDQLLWPEWLLSQWVNRGSQGHSDFGLRMSSKGVGAAQTPRGLIGALWQQATLAISGMVDFLQCLECGDWFGISAEHARPEKLFCSNACRMRAYRKRKKDQKESALA